VDRVLELPARGEREPGRAETREAQRDLPGVERRVAVLDALLGVEADAGGEVLARFAPHRLEDLGGQAHPVLQRAAVLVLARVARREERREGVGVRHVQLDTVVPGPARARRRLGVEPRDRRDLFPGEIADLLSPSRPGDLEEVDDLRDDLHGASGARALDRLAQDGEPREEPVVADPQQRSRAGLVHRHRFEDDQPRLSPGKAHVALGDVAVDHAVLARETRDHGGQHDPVRQAHPADRERLEELHARSTSRAMTFFWTSEAPS
jgi:hypothetical protein